jgi:hypothetical protein
VERRLPFQLGVWNIDRLEDDVADPPCRVLAASKRLR